MYITPLRASTSQQRRIQFKNTNIKTNSLPIISKQANISTSNALVQLVPNVHFRGKSISFCGTKYEEALNEISKTIKKLKRNKSQSADKLRNEVIEAYKGLINEQKDEAKKIIATYDPNMAENIDRLAGLETPKEIFTNIYSEGLWGSKESASGTGSEVKAVSNILNKMPRLFKHFGIKTIIDAPCGDYNWMQRLDYNFDKYLGVDIVDDLIAKNQEKYGTDTKEFRSGNLFEMDLPQSDLILCKDLFIHLSNEDVINTLKNFKRSGSKYLLTTNYRGLDKNDDIETGYFRTLDLTLPPFNLKKPISSIYENKAENKYLSLWNLQELEI